MIESLHHPDIEPVKSKPGLPEEVSNMRTTIRGAVSRAFYGAKDAEDFILDLADEWDSTWVGTVFDLSTWVEGQKARLALSQRYLTEHPDIINGPSQEFTVSQDPLLKISTASEGILTGEFIIKELLSTEVENASNRLTISSRTNSQGRREASQLTLLQSVNEVVVFADNEQSAGIAKAVVRSVGEINRNPNPEFVKRIEFLASHPSRWGQFIQPTRSAKIGTAQGKRPFNEVFASAVSVYAHEVEGHSYQPDLLFAIAEIGAFSIENERLQELSLYADVNGFDDFIPDIDGELSELFTTKANQAEQKRIRLLKRLLGVRLPLDERLEADHNVGYFTKQNDEIAQIRAAG